MNMRKARGNPIKKCSRDLRPKWKYFEGVGGETKKRKRFALVFCFIFHGLRFSFDGFFGLVWPRSRDAGVGGGGWRWEQFFSSFRQPDVTFRFFMGKTVTKSVTDRCVACACVCVCVSVWRVWRRSKVARHFALRNLLIWEIKRWCNRRLSKLSNDNRSFLSL